MKALAICLVLSVALASAISLQEAQSQFIHFQRKFNKAYDASEFATKFATFRRNLEIAEAHQKLNPKARFGVTKFMDIAPEDFAIMYRMPNWTETYASVTRPALKTDFSNKWTSTSFPGGPDPTNWDWSQQGVTTPVYDQGQCGSCWAFSATETIESYYAIGGAGSLTQFSMEQIVDCDTTDDGCNGGIPANAYNYVQSAGGIEPYADYPYTAGGGQSGSCQFNQGEVQATVTGYNTVSGESGLYQQASSAGPVSVCVDASSWQYYQGGVLTTCTNNIDHCVQLTGYANYGSSNAYWIVRNSWGTSWGESGFIWIEIGQDLCSIGDEATIASAGSA